MSIARMYKTVYDISVLLGVESIDFPGGAPYSREEREIARGGEKFRASKLVMSAHLGTHIDAPSHIAPNTKSIDQYSVQEFILPAIVVNIKDKESIRPSTLENLDIIEGDALLFRTDNSVSGRCTSGVFSGENFVYLSPATADLCVKKGVKLVGIDYISTDNPADKGAPTHRKLLGSNILILENINLKDVPPGRYTLFCLPLKIKGSEGSPVRAILID
jgi:arylformamidase